MPSQQALRSKAKSGSPAIGADIKEAAGEDLTLRALEASDGDEERAQDLLRDPKWLNENAQVVARDYAEGIEATTLQHELACAFSDQKSAPAEKVSDGKVEPKEK